MAYVYYNPNPTGTDTLDCATRAVAKALDISWDDANIKIFLMSHNMGEVMMSDAAWGAVLRRNGFIREIIPNSCPDCYTAEDFCNDHPVGTYVLAFGGHAAEDFCNDHPVGTYVLAFGGHAAAVVDGNLYDSGDTSHLIPIYYWHKEENNGSISGTERPAGSSDANSAK